MRVRVKLRDSCCPTAPEKTAGRRRTLARKNPLVAVPMDLIAGLSRLDGRVPSPGRPQAVACRPGEGFGDLAAARLLDLGAAVNRMPTLRIE